MKTVLCAAAGLAFAIPGLGGARAADETSPTLTIGATDFEGLPVAGVKFRATLEGLGVSPAETGEFGQATLILGNSDTIAVVELADARFQTLHPQQVSTADERLLLFRLFHADTSKMSAEERREFAQYYAMIAASQPAEPGDDKTMAHDGEGRPLPTPFRLTAFLAGQRRESSDAYDSQQSEIRAEKGAAISARLLSAHGQPVADTMIYLYVFDETIRQLRMAGFERTDEAGIAVFEGLEPGRFHRAEVTGVDGKVARSTIVLSREGQPVVLAPMVLRSPDEMLSGLVFFGDSPAANTLITSQPANGSPKLSTVTDGTGFFSLGPLPPETVKLEFQRSAADGPVTARMTAKPGEGELFVALDLLRE